ncbi:hypothetical protein C2G38_2182060 [Gigaspora rosea]|uniref:Uncharacterized protein n=1 Tax=Gigaspora rosea TaxID=44941 RepID=A0A397VCE2_9GLOM|nr:hypothetical protein C2G38_2182060 [Gigaspora rosea]
MILERNRWRAWVANLEAENGALRRRVKDIERRRVQEAEELEEENRELEEENREWQRRMEEVNKNRRLDLLLFRLQLGVPSFVVRNIFQVCYCYNIV